MMYLDARRQNARDDEKEGGRARGLRTGQEGGRKKEQERASKEGREGESGIAKTREAMSQ
eukprot:6197990-Pleurochrysis_carterae.AAC.7